MIIYHLKAKLRAPVALTEEIFEVVFIFSFKQQE